MERLGRWFGLGSEEKSNSSATETSTVGVIPTNERDIKSAPSSLHIATEIKDIQTANDALSNRIDPKVALYFKDFPEPYKTKAIVRFSSREGFYRWDFFRDLEMKREYESARRGDFIEDKRDYTKRLLEMQQEAEDDTNQAEPTSHVIVPAEEVEESALVKAVKRYIPVHPEESLGLKLFQAGNFTALGCTLLYAGITLRKRRPEVPKWQHYSAMAGTSYFFIFFQLAAVHRLMDWGYFDRSVDNRQAVMKFAEEMKQQFNTMINTVDFESKTKSK